MSKSLKNQINAGTPSPLNTTAQLADLNKILTVEEAKAFIKQHCIKNLEVHGNKVRFVRRCAGKVLKLNITEELTTLSILNSQKKLHELRALNDVDFIKLKQQQNKVKNNGDTIERLINDFINYDIETVTSSTMKGYKTCLRRIAKEFGEMSVTELNHDLIAAWVNTCLQEISAKTMKDTLFLLSKLVDRAFRNRLSDDLRIDFKALHIIANRLKKPNDLSDIDLLNIEDIKIIQAIDNHTLKLKGLHIIADCVILGAIGIGARIGELRALSLEDIAKTESGTYEIKIRRAIVLEEFKLPKVFNNVFPEVKVFSFANVSLERLMENAKQYKPLDLHAKGLEKVLSTKHITPLMINPSTQELYTEKEFLKEFRRLLAFAGINKTLTPRHLRHSFANICNNLGIDIDYISKTMTHCNTLTTQKHYIQTDKHCQTDEHRSLESFTSADKIISDSFIDARKEKPEPNKHNAIVRVLMTKLRRRSILGRGQPGFINPNASRTLPQGNHIGQMQ